MKIYPNFKVTKIIKLVLLKKKQNVYCVRKNHKTFHDTHFILLYCVKYKLCIPKCFRILPICEYFNRITQNVFNKTN